MLGKKKPEVLIVGAGPVGLTCALELTKNNIDVQIIDKEWQRAGHSYALALHAKSLKLFEHLGLLDKIFEHSYKVRTVGIYDDKEQKAQLKIADLEEDYSFVTVIQQNLLEKVLEDALLERGVKVMWHHRLAHMDPAENHTDVIIDKLMTDTLGYIISRTEQVVTKSIREEIPFIIGADGHYSFVRRSLDINYDSVGETKHFAVFEFKTDADLDHQMCISLAEGTANALWPLPDGFCRWSFQVLDTEASHESRIKERYEVQIGPGDNPELTQEYLENLLNKRAPWFKGSIENIRWRHMVRFEQRLADSYGRFNCWLTGDATHMTSPVGIQGMNGSFLEARQLTAAVVRILKENGDRQLLTDYNNKWLPEWRFMLGIDGGPKAKPSTDPWIAKHRKTLLASLPAFGDDLAVLMKQIGLKI